MTVADASVSTTRIRTVTELTRFEGRKLLASRLFIVGLALPGMGALVFFLRAFGDPSATWVVDAWTVIVGFALAAIFTMVAVNRAALRDDREHAREQHEALPVGPGTRTLAMVSAALWPALVLVLLFGLVVGLASTQVQISWPTTILRILQVGVLVLLFGSLGVAGAVWIRNAFVIPMVAIALYFIHPSDEVLASWHAIWPFATPNSPLMAGAHVVYLIGVTLTLTAIALARTDRSRAVLITGIVGLATIVAPLVILWNCPVNTCLV